MVSTITGNPILDFTVIQTMSVFYLSEAALHLLKWQDSESRYAGRLFNLRQQPGMLKPAELV